MLLGGDEIGRSQDGEGNPYDVDTPVSWYDWSPSAAKDSMYGFVRNVIDLRLAVPALRRPDPLFVSNSAWYALDGTPMTDDEWNDGFRHGVAV